MFAFDSKKIINVKTQLATKVKLLATQRGVIITSSRTDCYY